jgi:predicted RNA-binding protein with PUA-like domain
LPHWLLKTEPDAYAWDDLARDKSAVWDGVTNALALKHLRAMTKGDLVLVYHTGDERAAVGVAQVASDPYPDPKAHDERLVVVDLKPKQKLGRPITLAEIKADPTFAGWDFLRIGRLSVVPVPEEMWARILYLSNGAASRDAVAGVNARRTKSR